MYICMSRHFLCSIPSKTRLSGPSQCPPVLSGSPQGCLTSVHKPVCWFCLHMVTSQFPLAPASCVSARKLGEVNRNQMSKSMPCGAISRCLQSVHFLKNIVQSFEAYSLTGADLDLQGRELTGTSPSGPLPGLSGTYPRL